MGRRYGLNRGDQTERHRGLIHEVARVHVGIGVEGATVVVGVFTLHALNRGGFIFAQRLSETCEATLLRLFEIDVVEGSPLLDRETSQLFDHRLILGLNPLELIVCHLQSGSDEVVL